jgi:hypothetical protein
MAERPPRPELTLVTSEPTRSRTPRPEHIEPLQVVSPETTLGDLVQLAGNVTVQFEPAHVTVVANQELFERFLNFKNDADIGTTEHLFEYLRLTLIAYTSDKSIENAANAKAAIEFIDSVWYRLGQNQRD